MAKQRADLLLCARGLASSRSRARAMIEAGSVTADGVTVTKPAALIDEAAILTAADAIPYVSRGGLKLEKALNVWDIDLTGVDCADVGASTGGFTDCMLQRGAAHVTAIDVGTDQLAPVLRTDPRVTVLEQHNARELAPDWFGRPPAFAAADVSFISVRLILPGIFRCLSDGGRAVVLVKPQFEAGRDRVGKKGVVRDPAVHRDVLRETAEYAAALGFSVKALDFSPITGPEGNLEFLMLLGKDAGPGLADLSRAAAKAVEEAHRTL